MQEFYRQLATWQPFFIGLAALCATLVGLLFVALSLHEHRPDKESKTNLRRLAQHTFADFVQVLFVGLFFSVPEMTPGFFGIGTVLIVGFGLRQIGARLLEAWRDRAHALHRHHVMRRLVLSLVGRALLLAAGLTLLLPKPDADIIRQSLLLVFSGSEVLLISALSNAWFLFTEQLD